MYALGRAYQKFSLGRTKLPPAFFQALLPPVRGGGVLAKSLSDVSIQRSESLLVCHQENGACRMNNCLTGFNRFRPVKARFRG